MVHLVLVHGAWHGPSCWERLLPLLDQPGVTCHAPCLAGLGERASEPPESVGLGTHVEEVVGLLLSSDLRNVVLVGHSYAGIVATLVAAQVPERVRTLVYMDSFVPQPGSALLDLIDSAEAGKLRDVARQCGGAVPPFPPAAYGVYAPEDAAWLAERLTPMPVRCFEEQAAFDPRTLAPIRQVYIRATAGGPPDRFGRFAREFPGRDNAGYFEVASGHDMMLTHPRETARILLAECERVA